MAGKKRKDIGIFLFLVILLILFSYITINLYISEDNQNIDSEILVREDADGTKVYYLGDNQYRAVIPMSSPIEAKQDYSNLEYEVGEVIEKRTYNSQTNQNKDGSFTTTIFGRNAFFYDGEQYVELNKVSEPRLEKKEIALEQKPFYINNVFDFGEYKIHSGINISIENEELILRDAKGNVVGSLPRPFSTDANGDVSLDEYVIEIKGIGNEKDKTGLIDDLIGEGDGNENKVDGEGYDRMLSIKVRVDKQWLKDAEYPVVVDPEVTLNNASGVYSGTSRWSSNLEYSRVDNSSFIYPAAIPHDAVYIGNNSYNSLVNFYYLDRGFYNFDLSSIPGGVKITDTKINLTINQNGTSQSSSACPPLFDNSNIIWGGPSVNITRLNNTHVGDFSVFPYTGDGNQSLFFNLTGNGAPGDVYVSNVLPFYSSKGDQVVYDLGSQADQDVQDQMGNLGFFSIAFVSNNETLCTGGQLGPSFVLDTVASTANMSKLIVTYSLPINMTVYPQHTGTLTQTASGGNSSSLGSMTTGIVFDDPDYSIQRTFMTFPTTNISVNSTISNITLFYYVSSTSLASGDSIEFRKIDAVANSSSNAGYLFGNISHKDITRSYGISTGSNVSSIGWKNVTFNNNFNMVLEEKLNNLKEEISIGINSSVEGTTPGTDNLLTIQYNGLRPYLVVEYFEGNGSSVTYNPYYDAHFYDVGGGPSETTASAMRVGVDGDLFVSFASFITSSIDDSADIKKAYLRLNISTFGPGLWATSDYLNISRLNNLCINSSTGQEGYSLILSAPEYKIINGLGTGSGGMGELDVDLGDDAVTDIKNSLSLGCFSVGFAPNQFGADGTFLEIMTSESNYPPTLNVVFEGDFNYCDLSPFGNHACNMTCTYVDREISVPANFSVYDSCTLGLAGSTNMTFLSEDSFLYVYKEGIVWINDTAGFNKK